MSHGSEMRTYMIMYVEDHRFRQPTSRDFQASKSPWIRTGRLEQFRLTSRKRGKESTLDNGRLAVRPLPLGIELLRESRVLCQNPLQS